MTTGERIRAMRRAAGLTQKQLGEMSGIAEPTIRRYELGKLNPKRETLEKIANPLGVHWLDLAGDGFVEDLDNDLEYAWDDWLHSNGVFFWKWSLKGHVGIVIHFSDTNESFFLTREQASQLPQDSIILVKNMIRNLGKNNEKNAFDNNQTSSHSSRGHAEQTLDSTDGKDTPAPPDAPEGPKKPK